MRRNILVALCSASLGLMPTLGWAQVVGPLVPIPPLPAGPEAPPQPGEPAVVGKTVTDRARPEVDPLGIRFGDFFFFPRAEIDEGYNDNLFATETGKVGAWLTQIAPSFDIISNLPTNEIEVSAGAALGRYSSHTSENYDDAFGSVSGRIDLTALTHILAGVSIDRLHEPRTSPNSPGNAAAPVVYNTENGNIGIEQTGTRLGYLVSGNVTRWDYNAVPAFGGGYIFQSDRDETGYEGVVKGTYEFFPDYQAYLRGSGNTQQFDHAAGNGIPIRNSNGYRIDAGMRVDLTGVTYADVYGGWLEQNYSASQFGTIGGPDFGASVVWNFSTLDTLKLTSLRTVTNSNAEIGTGAPGTALSPGYLGSILGVSLDHELLRNVLLNGIASWETDDWKGIDRTDDIYSFGAGAKYLMNRNLYLGFSWTFQRRDSSGTQSTTGYSQNIFLLRLSTQI
jgi:hypothetical protein